MILFPPKLFSSSNYIWNVLHAIENVTSSCRPLRSLCGTAMGFIKAGLLLGISMAAKGGLGWNTFCYKCWTLVLVVGDLSQRHSARQIILKTKGWIIGQELLRYVLFLPFCPKALMEANWVVLVCTEIMAEICAADAFLSPCFPGTVAWGANRIQAGLLCFFCITQSWVMEQLWLSQWIRIRDSVQGKGWWAIAAEIIQFLLAARLCEQCSGFGKVLSPSYIHITFLAHSSSFINQLGLKIWWLWGRSFLSCHCLGAIESPSPLQKSQSNTRGKQDNSLKPGFHDLESSSANTICSPADVMPSTQSQPSRGKVSHLGSVHHWPFHFLFHTNAKKEFYIYFPSLK